MDRARTLLQTGRGVVLQDLLNLIQALSGKMENICLHDLTELLERDPVVVSRVLSAANQVRNNPGISPLTSLSHAIHQIGLNKIRGIAVSMMLLEGAAGVTQCPEQRAAAVHALCAGLISRSCADNLGYADPDLLFACGTLRNLGAVLLPALSAEHCREVVVLRKTLTEEQAFRRLFGLTPLDLSREMIRTLRMPVEILHAMKDCQPNAMGSAGSQLSGRILCISEFSTQLAALALSPKLGTPLFLQQAHVLARRFAKIVPEAGTLIVGALDFAYEELNALTKHGNFISPGVLARLRGHAKFGTHSPGAAPGADAPPSFATPPAPEPGATEAGKTAADTALAAPASSAPDAPPLAPPPGDSVAAAENEPAAEPGPVSVPAMDWTTHLAGSIAFESQAEAPPTHAVSMAPEDPWVSVLAAIQQVMQADHCAIFLGRKGAKSASLHRWTGGFGGPGGATPVCTTTERTVFGVCLNRRETVLIHDGLDASLDNYLPPWMGLACSRPGAFLLLALSTEQPAEGFVFLTWTKARKIAITAAQSSLIRSLITPHLSAFAPVASR